MSAYDPDKLEFWEVCKLVNYSKQVIWADLRDPDCPPLKPILADDGRPLFFAGVKLYDKYKAQDWAQKFLAWKGGEAERRKLGREQDRQRIAEAQAKQEQEIAAGREMRAGFRAMEEANRSNAELNQAAAYARSGTDPEVRAAELARLRSIGL
ncbi:hypothetical protein QTI24_26605 [Variovorax sp. J22P240]|uniref:hypothetical protein n=1 Tax=Variovorax sp. J22P240 TaxID=3053514 RepID=UPI002577A02B|nr:hypothetical protein [Variovorax sp. J22P240]MDM0002204.1 hypothetical protein [Variovorax sp. J22P240]